MKNFKMNAAGSAKPRQVMPPQNWSALSTAGGAGLQLVDANGAVITGVDPTAVTTTLTVEDTAGAPSTLVTVAAGADSLHYTISKAAGVSGTVVLKATLAYNSGSPGPFDSSLQLTLDLPVASDLQIVFGAA